MLNKKIKIYLINLDRSPDKLAHATGMLNDAGLPFTRIPAVDGAKLDMDNMESFAVREFVEKNKWVTPSVIGCSLSHIAAYKEMFADPDCQWGVMLEDDVEFSPDIVDVLNRAIEVINTTDVFLLYFHGDKKTFSRTVKIPIKGQYAFHAAMDFSSGYSTGAYLLHRDAASKLAQYNFPVRNSPDSWHVFLQQGAIGGLWALLPPISSPSYFGSDIGYTKMGIFLRSLENLRFLPFGFLMRQARKYLKTTEVAYHLVDGPPFWLPGKSESVFDSKEAL